MNATKHSTLLTIFIIMNKGDNHYITVSVRKVKELLKNYHKIDVQQRWIFEVLRFLEENGYINRQRRYEKKTPWEIKQLPSMITITVKGLKYLAEKKTKGALKALKAVLNWLKKDDKRWPAPKDIIRNYKPESEKIDESYEEKKKRKAAEGKRPIDPDEANELLSWLKKQTKRA